MTNESTRHRADELETRAPGPLDVQRYRRHVETRWDGRRLRSVLVLEERVGDAERAEGRFVTRRVEQDLGAVCEPMS